jgi:hypothetical protein
MTRTLSLPAFLCAPVIAALLWQNPSCQTPRAGMDNNSRQRQQNANDNASNSNTQAPADLEGLWGGLHVSMEITNDGAEISYDCAHGSITEKIVPDSSGKFTVKGFHVKERPGPSREGEEPRSEAASYSGLIDGHTMTLTVTLPATNETIGTFTLTKEQMGRIRKCK